MSFQKAPTFVLCISEREEDGRIPSSVRSQHPRHSPHHTPPSRNPLGIKAQQKDDDTKPKKEIMTNSFVSHCADWLSSSARLHNMSKECVMFQRHFHPPFCSRVRFGGKKRDAAREGRRIVLIKITTLKQQVRDSLGHTQTKQTWRCCASSVQSSCEAAVS